MAYFKVNDCVYQEGELFLFTNIDTKFIKAKTIQENTFGDGYRGYNDVLVFPQWFYKTMAVDVRKFMQIKKILHMNYVSCINIIEADNCSESYIKVFGDSKLTIDISLVSPHPVNISLSDHTAAYGFRTEDNFLKFISEETWQKVKIQTDNTIKLIDDIWPNKNS